VEASALVFAAALPALIIAWLQREMVNKELTLCYHFVNVAGAHFSALIQV
jgi:nitrate/nitrite transporter NarK